MNKFVKVKDFFENRSELTTSNLSELTTKDTKDTKHRTQPPKKEEINLKKYLKS